MSTSHLWALIEEWRDAQLFPVSQAALADKVGITRSAMSQWKKGQATPSPENLRSLSRVTRIQYERLLDAVVRDMGYMTDEEVGDSDRPAPITQAGDPPADNVQQFPAPTDAEPPETWAAKVKGEGGSLYERDGRVADEIDEGSQDPDDHKPRRR